MLFNSSFVLASNSRSRYKLLKNADLTFVKKKPLCNERTIKKNLEKKGSSPKKNFFRIS